MVQLQTISAERYDAWQVQIWELYAEELIQSGVAEAKAKQDAKEGYEHTMPGGVLAPDNFVFDVVHNNEPVGIVWLVKQVNDWFIYDIDITESRRGQGLGRQTMKAIEIYVRENGGTSIGLSVFGFNEVARKLYLSEGYETTRYQMKKSL
jgi:GNAT superfamily N-acetyltransferase